MKIPQIPNFIIDAYVERFMPKKVWEITDYDAKGNPLWSTRPATAEDREQRRVIMRGIVERTQS